MKINNCPKCGGARTSTGNPAVTLHHENGSESCPLDLLYPEHAKLTKIAGTSQAIGEFVEWLGERGIMLASHVKYDDVRHPRLAPVAKPITALLAEYFDIDQNKIETEKRAMIAVLSGGGQ